VRLVHRFIRSSLFRGSETVVNIVAGLFLLPFLLGRLGASDYGLWIVLTSVTGSFYVFDLGFAAAVTRTIAVALGEGDQDHASSVVSSALVTYVVLALAVLAATLFVVLAAARFVTDPTQLGNARIILLLCGASLAFEFPVKAYAGIASYHMRYDLSAIARIVLKIASVLATVIAVGAGYSIIALAVIGCCTSIISTIAFAWIARGLEPDLQVAISNVDRRVFRDLLGFSSWTFASDAAAMLRGRGDLWIAAFVLGNAAMTTYYVATRLVDYTLALITSALGMTTALFSRAFGEGGIDALRPQVLLFVRINSVVAWVAVCGFLGLAAPVFGLWMRGEVDAGKAGLIASIVLCARMVSFVADPISSGLTAVRKPIHLAATSVTETVFSLGAVWIAAAVVGGGLLGVAIGMLAGTIAARALLLPTLAAKEIGISRQELFRASVRPTLIFSPVAVALLLLRTVAAVESGAYLVAYSVVLVIVLAVCVLSAIGEEDAQSLAGVSNAGPIRVALVLRGWLVAGNPLVGGRK
jgi:O-antigen/teichoic acid export membrane protein